MDNHSTPKERKIILITVIIVAVAVIVQVAHIDRAGGRRPITPDQAKFLASR